jgi:hypothetical protein
LLGKYYYPGIKQLSHHDACSAYSGWAITVWKADLSGTLMYRESAHAPWRHVNFMVI